MKKLLSAIVLVCLSISLYAQNDITKFLGIPITGTKQEMIEKLKAKGFRYDNIQEKMTGEFNGEEVDLFIVTDNNKVWRIAVFDKNTRSARQIIYRFNKLYDQFYRNGRYLPISDNRISEDEDLNYNILIKDQEYSASFLQYQSKNFREELKGSSRNIDDSQLKILNDIPGLPDKSRDIVKKMVREIQSASIECNQSIFQVIDSLIYENSVTYENLMEHVYEEQLELLTAITEISKQAQAEIKNLSAEEQDRTTQCLEDFLKTNNFNSNEIIQDIKSSMFPNLEEYNAVWYEISRDGNDRYRILMFYDNPSNKADGEDL